MKHIKHHPINDKAQKLSKDMKKQELIKPKKDKKLPLEDHLSDPTISKRVSKPSKKKKLSSEKHLSADAGKIRKINEYFSDPDSDVIKVNYIILNENMSDDEMDNAPAKEFIITENMILNLLEENIEWDRDGGDYIDTDNLFIEQI
jgi:hypothetical protein